MYLYRESAVPHILLAFIYRIWYTKKHVFTKKDVLKWLKRKRK